MTISQILRDHNLFTKLSFIHSLQILLFTITFHYVFKQLNILEPLRPSLSTRRIPLASFWWIANYSLLLFGLTLAFGISLLPSPSDILIIAKATNLFKWSTFILLFNLPTDSTPHIVQPFDKFIRMYLNALHCRGQTQFSM